MWDKRRFYAPCLEYIWSNILWENRETAIARQRLSLYDTGLLLDPVAVVPIY